MTTNRVGPATTEVLSKRARNRRVLTALLAAAVATTAVGGAARATAPPADGIRGCAPECVDGFAEPGALPAGDYTTTYFLDGHLTLTFEPGWSSAEDQGVEFNAAPEGEAGSNRVLFWSDLVPVGPDGAVVEGIPNTAEGFLTWLDERPGVELSDPVPTTIGVADLPATMVDMTIADDAENEEPEECPDDVCVLPFTWVNAGPNKYGTVQPWVLRMFVADVTYGGVQHTLTVAVEAQDQATLETFLPEAERLIASAGAPLDAPTDPTTRTFKYVAFGDSWPEGAHCNGCTPFPQLWAEDLDAHPGWDIQFTDYTGSNERTPDQSKGSASLLAALQNDDETRAAVQTADIILIATGPNELDAGEVWHGNFGAILAEIRTLRAGEPTAIRLVNAANSPFLPGEIFEVLTYAICDAAEAHDAICIDVRPLILGPAFDQPGDENSTETMRAITDVLLAIGLPELSR